MPSDAAEMTDMQWRREQEERNKMECEKPYLIQKKSAEEENSQLHFRQVKTVYINIHSFILHTTLLS